MAKSKAAELQDTIDEAIDILDESDDVQSSRADLAAAVTSALATLRGEDIEDEDSDTDDDDED
jgi:hypothetical protein